VYISFVLFLQIGRFVRQVSTLAVRISVSITRPVSSRSWHFCLPSLPLVPFQRCLVPAANDHAADVFAASQGETHDGESGRRVGYPGAFPGEARPLSGEGPQSREHAATSSRHQARQLPAHSRQVSPTIGVEPFTSIARLNTWACCSLISRVYLVYPLGCTRARAISRYCLRSLASIREQNCRKTQAKRRKHRNKREEGNFCNDSLAHYINKY